MTKKPLIIVTGPTAVGKSAMSVALAKKIGGSVISADSMQVYRYMDIGSAKIKKEEMGGIPHYLIDVLNPQEEFHVVRFQTLAKQALEEIYAAGRIPIVAGGTGFYIQALLYDIDFTKQSSDTAYREELMRFAGENGAAALHKMLEAVDPESAAVIHENNIKRTIRALEFHRLSGEKISAHNEKERQNRSPYRFAYFVLTDEREKIYERIDARVDAMMEEGLLDEVKALRDMGCTRDMVSMQGLGYKELFSYLDGEIPLEEAVRIIKRDTRHFAKRQLTWFKRERDVIWLCREEFLHGGNDEILEKMLRVLSERNISSADFVHHVAFGVQKYDDHGS